MPLSKKPSNAGTFSNNAPIATTIAPTAAKGTSKTEVTPDKDATAWITGKTFHISNGEIKESLKFGNILMKPTSSGNLAIGDYAEFGSTVRIGNPSSRYTRINSNGLMVNNENTVIAQIGYGTAGDPNGGNSVYAFYTFGERKTGTSSGGYSLIEGCNNAATGFCAHAEGWNSTASGVSSHAEGSYSEASGDDSHAEGRDTKAIGQYSHAGGLGTIAKNNYQTAIGRYNADGNYAFSVGNGSSDTERSNAFTVDWSGNIRGQSLVSPDALILGFEGNHEFKPYFTKGDTTTVIVYLQGRIVTSGKEILFYVPFSRPIISATGVSVSSVNGIAVSQNGKSLYGSSSYVKPNAYSASIIGDGHGVNIRATMPNTTNATNNATCAITASIKITFS